MIPHRFNLFSRGVRPAILAASIATIVTVGAEAQSSILYQAPTGPNGTWNLYEYVLDAADFVTAHTTSIGITNPVAGATPGFLAEIGSALENAAVNQMVYRQDAWIGLTDRVGVAVGASEGTFKWTNGAPLTYTNWNGGEPNNSGGEDAVHITGGGGWNDHKSSYAFDMPLADPGSTEEGGGPFFRYIREWPTASPTPIFGVRSAAALSFADTLTNYAPNPTVGNFGVREYTGLTLEATGNIYDTMNKLFAGGLTSVEGQRARLDFTDPQTNGGGGPTVSTAPLPYLSDTGADDNNFVAIARGRVVVPSSGQWTIQVHSDDGFALRVKGQAFTNVYGGQVDALDPSTMFFFGDTGDSSTRGVLNLNAGEYDIEVVSWEHGGGAFYEVTTAKGAIPDAGSAQWLAMGDISGVVARPNVLRMSAPATVRTAAEFTAGGGTANNIAEVRSLITAAKAANATNNSTAASISVGDGQAVPFPTGTPGDQFAMEITGKFTLDDGDLTLGESFTVTFGLISDDGSQFHIFGKSFDAVNDFSGDGTATLVDVNGDMALTAEYLTGNTNAFGRITLTEGTYDFESYMYEEGGGAYEQILYSIGDKVNTGLDGTFAPISTLANLPDNQGWGLVPEPTSGLLIVAGMSLIGLRRRRG